MGSAARSARRRPGHGAGRCGEAHPVALGRAPVAVVALAGEEPAERLALACDHVLARRAQAFLTSARDGLVLAVLQPGSPGLLPGLRAAVSERSPGRVLAGSGSLRGYEQLPQAV